LELSISCPLVPFRTAQSPRSPHDDEVPLRPVRVISTIRAVDRRGTERN
jgi:hypothetical protein